MASVKGQDWFIEFIETLNNKVEVEPEVKEVVVDSTSSKWKLAERKFIVEEGVEAEPDVIAEEEIATEIEVLPEESTTKTKTKTKPKIDTETEIK
jgi:hypothetical protein